MELEVDNPKKRKAKTRKGVTVASQEILAIVEDAELNPEHLEQNKPAKPSIKRRSRIKQIVVQHNSQPESLRPLIQAESKKEVGVKDFFERHTKVSLVNNQDKIAHSPLSGGIEIKNDLKTLDSDSEIVLDISWSSFHKMVSIIFILASFLYVGYQVYIHYLNPNNPLQSLSKIVILPTTEHPKVYMVGEDAGLLDDPLFKGVLPGDKIFFYEKQGSMYVFRENLGKLVTIIMVDVDNHTETSNPVTVDTGSTTVATTTSDMSTTTNVTKSIDIGTSTSKVKTLTATSTKK